MSKIIESIFGKKLTVKEQINLWKKNLRKESRGLDRNIRHLQQEERKTIAEMKKVAKQNQIDTVKILAQNIVQIRTSVQRLYQTRAQLNSVRMKIDEQYAQARIMKAFQVSATIMGDMNRLCNMKEATVAMRNMQKEMAKAGMIEEMTEEMMEDSFEEVEVEDTVEQVLKEVVGEELAGLVVGNEAMPEQVQQQTTTTATSVEDDEMNSRVAALGEL